MKRTNMFVFQQAKSGHQYCGDSYYYIETDTYFVCAISDGLGSGVEAYSSSSLVMEMIESSHHEDVHEIMRRCNKVLIKERGVVLTIIKVNFYNQHITYSNIGNITFTLFLPDGEIVRPIPSRGFLSGKWKQKIKVKHLQYKQNSWFIMCTDGVDSNWQHLLWKELRRN